MFELGRALMRLTSHELSAGRPCERRDPSPLASKVKKGLCSSAKTRVLGAAMSEITLTLGSLRSQGRGVWDRRKRLSSDRKALSADANWRRKKCPTRPARSQS